MWWALIWVVTSPDLHLFATEVTASTTFNVNHAKGFQFPLPW